MSPALWIPASCALALALSSCGTTGGGDGGFKQTGTGPFDQNGTYVEEWADNPSKWRKNSDAPSPHELKSDDLPEIAQNDQPPQNSIPLAPETSSKANRTAPKSAISRTEVTAKSQTKVAVKPKAVVAKSKPKSSRYLVRNGDSLSLIASRTGSSVSAIKRANGISGTFIRAGQALTIPRK